MTFTLVRLGLPNSIAVLALAMVPIMSIALASAGRTDGVRSHNPQATAVAETGSDPSGAFAE
jgi:hypothetical protein